MSQDPGNAGGPVQSLWSQFSSRLGGSGCGCAALIALLVLLVIGVGYIGLGRLTNHSSSSSPSTAAYTPSGPTGQYRGNIHIVLSGQYAADISGHPTSACVQVQAGKSYYLVAESSSAQATLIITMNGFPEQGSQHYPKAGTYTVPDPKSATAAGLNLQVTLRTAETLGALAKPGGKLVVSNDGKSGKFDFDFDESTFSPQPTHVHATGTYQCF